MKNKKDLFFLIWFTAFWIFLTQFFFADKPAPKIEKEDPQQRVIQTEKELVKILTNSEARQKFCTNLEITKGDQTQPVLLITCTINLADGVYKLEYAPSQSENCLTITTPTGEVMSDNNLDGRINYARDQEGGKELIDFPTMKTNSGEEHREYWQTKFATTLQNIKTLDISMIQGFCFT